MLNRLPQILYDLIPGVMRVKVLPSIDTTGLTVDDASDLAEKCRALMLLTYHEISEVYKEEYATMKPLPNHNKDK